MTWASDQSMSWPVSIACSARAEVMELAVVRACTASRNTEKLSTHFQVFQSCMPCTVSSLSCYTCYASLLASIGTSVYGHNLNIIGILW